MNATERTAWLESRRKGIGSSDVAPILGMSRWNTALGVYLSKVEAAREEKMEPRLEWGLRKEPVIAAAIQDHFGWQLKKVPTVTHAEHAFLIASVDRENQNGEPCEIKTAERADSWGEPETADIPDYYYVQVQHQLAVVRSNNSPAERAWVFVLIGQGDFRRYMVPYDPEFLPTVIDPLREFWDRVERREPPEPDWSHPETLAAVQRLCKPKPGTFIDLDETASDLADDYERFGEEANALTEQRTERKARLINLLGEFETGRLPDGRMIVRKEIHRKGYTVEPTTYFDFRLKKGKVSA